MLRIQEEFRLADNTTAPRFNPGIIFISSDEAFAIDFCRLSGKTAALVSYTETDENTQIYVPVVVAAASASRTPKQRR